MKARGIVAIVPMKPLHMSKTRLADVLTPSQRSSLSLGMFHIVVRAALDSAADEVWVFGGDDTVKRHTLEMGARWNEDRGKDLNDSLYHAFHKAYSIGYAPVYLPADLPFLQAQDVDALVSASGQGQMLVLSPALRDAGTNAMLVPLASRFRPALGLDSFERHKENAEGLGIAFAVHESDGLGLDLDMPEDLKVCEERKPGFLEGIISTVNLPSAVDSC